MKTPLLQVKSCTKVYHSARRPITALQEVNFALDEGEIVGLLGVNGAGKTTLSSLIASLIPPSSGDILWQGASIYKDVIDYRLHIGLCPQKPDLEPSLAVREHLVFAGRVYGMSLIQARARAEEVIDLLGLQRYADEKPDVLSGGYKQRVLIARALMHKPKLVILDEPTVGLDPHVRRELWDIIKALKQQGVSVILTTHYLDEAEYLADRVVVLDAGRVIESDTPANLAARFQEKNLEEVFLRLMKERQAEDGKEQQ
jgi:ABC-2 type transport system ATP-binding protein